MPPIEEQDSRAMTGKTVLTAEGGLDGFKVDHQTSYFGTGHYDVNIPFATVSGETKAQIAFAIINTKPINLILGALIGNFSFRVREGQSAKGVPKRGYGFSKPTPDLDFEDFGGDSGEVLTVWTTAIMTGFGHPRAGTTMRYCRFEFTGLTADTSYSLEMSAGSSTGNLPEGRNDATSSEFYLGVTTSS